jgi:PEP-CTERM motif
MMQQLRHSIRAVEAALLIILGGAGAAQAGFITFTNPPDLFPVGGVFAGVPPTCVTSGPLAGVCTSNQRQTTVSATYSFSGGNEDVALNAVLTGDTTDPTGVFSLTGTEDLTLIGRGSSYQTGTFAIDVTSEDFTGTFFGVPLELTFDPSGVHDGSISITPMAQGNRLGYLIDATLNLSAVVIVDGVSTPLGVISTTIGVPEPSTWAMMLAGFAGLGFAGFRARRAAGPVA